MAAAGDFVDFFDMLGQTEWNRSLQRTLIHWMGIGHMQDVLDVGCGAGRFTIQLAQRAKWVTGIDISPQIIERAKLIASDYRLDNVTFLAGDARKIPFPDHTFDVATCFNLLFLCDKPENIIAELVRVVKPGGSIIILDPSAHMNPWSAQIYCERHQMRDFERDSLLSWSTAAARSRLYSLDEWKQMFDASTCNLADYHFLLDNLVLIMRLMSK